VSNMSGRKIINGLLQALEYAKGKSTNVRERSILVETKESKAEQNGETSV
jgi:hypothetical protein